MSDVVDVVVLGGGPAGLAIASILGGRGLRVAVLERRRFGGPDLGELVGREAEAVLRAAGIWEGFLAMKPQPFRGVRAAWGSPELSLRPLLTRPAGEGWHVDRRRMAGLLAQRARDVGVQMVEELGVPEVVSTPVGWEVSAKDERWKSRFLVDASGRSGPATALGIPGRKWFSFDRQVAVAAWARPTDGRNVEPELMMEAAEEGWWYASPQPGGHLLVCLLTDPDLVPLGPFEGLGSRFRAALDRTIHIRALAQGTSFERGPETVLVDAGRLLPDRGRLWRAIGDAAFGGDPLSGDGIARGLRSAATAATSIERTLAAGSDEEGENAPLDVGDAFREYLERRSRHYALENRWPDALFWRRRNAGDWRSIPLTLDLDTRLCWDGRPPSPVALAPSEAFIPQRLTRTLLNELATPRRAREALAILRASAPLGDRWLHVALQRLVQDGLLSQA